MNDEKIFLKWMTLLVLLYTMLELALQESFVLLFFLGLASVYILLDWLKSMKLLKQVDAGIQDLKAYNLSEKGQKS